MVGLQPTVSRTVVPQDNRLVLTERLADPIARLRIEDQAIDPS
jgi:hypothetical protein